MTYFDTYRVLIHSYWSSVYPVPFVMLLEGLTLGIDNFKLVPLFKKSLVTTGTIHVAVVSGYNISLVLNSMKKVLGNRITPLRTLIYIGVTLLYSIVCGFEPPIVRAWLMASVVQIGKLFGRALNVFLILIITALAMILCDKLLLGSLSFWLSFLATWGLVQYGTLFQKILLKLTGIRQNVFMEDLASSLAATLLVWPVLSYKFSNISIYAPFINMLVLWTIPLATITGFIGVFIAPIDILLHTNISFLCFLIVTPLLDIFVTAVEFASKIPGMQKVFTITEIPMVLYYTFVILILPIIIKTVNKPKKDL